MVKRNEEGREVGFYISKWRSAAVAEVKSGHQAVEEQRLLLRFGRAGELQHLFPFVRPMPCMRDTMARGKSCGSVCMAQRWF